jgi:NAD(P)-dependent dehydrogenase (short-subunit alcohol dehydrogenase family)
MSAADTRRACLVTGAGRGLGREIALHLAAPGTHLLLHHHRSVDGATEAAAEAERRGAIVTLLAADLADPAARERLMQAVASAAPALQVLVNNVGVYPEQGLLETTPEQWATVLELGCSAVFHLTLRAVPLLRAAAPSRVINLGDSSADRIAARVQATPYHVAKLGVHVLTRSFAKALGPDGVTVNQISPGFLETSVGDPGSPMPMGRRGTALDVLGALDYLLSPAADYVSGANLVVSGAWNA